MADTVLELAAANGHANGSMRSVVDMVRASSPDEKEEVLNLLLKELIDVNGGEGLILLGEMGYYVPPIAAEAQCRANRARLTPEELNYIDNVVPFLDPNDVLSDDEIEAVFNEPVVEQV